MRCISDYRVEEEIDCESDGHRVVFISSILRNNDVVAPSCSTKKKRTIHLDWDGDDCGTKYYLFLTTYSSSFDGVDDAVNLGSL